jgi:hypothetical protein
MQIICPILSKCKVITKCSFNTESSSLLREEFEYKFVASYKLFEEIRIGPTPLYVAKEVMKIDNHCT